MAKLLNYLFLVRLVAVKLQAKLFQAHLFELVVYHAECGEFFGYEQYLFTVGKLFGYYVSNRLAFARTGRSLQHETFALLRPRHRFCLARIGVYNVM